MVESHWNLSRIASIVSLLSLMGCPDPEGALEEFETRKAATNNSMMQALCKAPDYEFTPNPTTDTMCADTNRNGHGLYYARLSTTLARKVPLHFMVEIGTEGDQAYFNLTPVSVDGDLIKQNVLETKLSVNPDGTFVVNTGEVEVSGLANPLSGSDIVANLVLEGKLLTDGNICGALAGCLIRPYSYDLVDSTFTLYPLDGEDAVKAEFARTLDVEDMECPTTCNALPATLDSMSSGAGRSAADASDSSPSDDSTADAGGSVDDAMINTDAGEEPSMGGASSPDTGTTPDAAGTPM
ncbi:MAG: hypothetical protein VX589_18900 [Myxococcota bacterium]|nr:hypothetical protein [Myxococcota bacterium]